MQKINDEDLQDLFPPVDGGVEMIYGRIRNGKTTYAVRCMINDLRSGRIVYSNIKIDLDNIVLDERDMFGKLFKSTITFNSFFLNFKKENYYFFNPVTGMCNGVKVFDPLIKGDEVRWLNSLLDCCIYYDEGHWLLDSYEGTSASMEKRKLITETGHMGRTIIIISQRSQAIAKNARANVNVYWKCKKQSYWFFWERLYVYQFQDMKGDDVDEDAEPVTIESYGDSSIYWGLFNTRYLREGKEKSQNIYFEAYDLTIGDKLSKLFGIVFGRRTLEEARSEDFGDNEEYSHGGFGQSTEDLSDVDGLQIPVVSSEPPKIRLLVKSLTPKEYEIELLHHKTPYWSKFKSQILENRFSSDRLEREKHEKLAKFSQL